MTDILIQIQQEMRSGQLANQPHVCAEYRARLAGEYSFWCGQLEDILKEKPYSWNLARPKYKSDAACDKWWNGTEQGINETGLVMKLRRIEKMMMGLNGLLKIAEGQARNTY